VDGVPHIDATYRSLQLTEAQARRQLLRITSYDVRLDLGSDDATFGSVTTVTFESDGGPTFVDLKPRRVNSIRLNDAEIPASHLDHGRVPIDTQPGTNVLVVDAVMAFRNDGEGLHRSVDPADGRHYVYGMSFMDAAPSIFACFDQPDLKAPYTFHVRAPKEWTVIGNAPGEQVERGPGETALWEFAESQPLSTYFVTLVAGPWHLISDAHDGIPLGLSARQSIAADLDADADELFTVTRQCFDEFHRLFGIRYPFGNYHQAFVPEFNAGAMENPGCVTFRDPLIFSSRVTRGTRIKRASTVAHEMAHQWFGNLVTPAWWDDLWLNESFAEYMGNRVTADVTEYADAWTHDAYVRRQWGLQADQGPSTHPVAGNGAADASSALQDFDGISYAKGSSILKQLNARLGDEIFFAGAIDHFESHRFGNATMHDLLASWEKAGAGDLSSFTSNWLRTAGPDSITYDRTTQVVRRVPPAGHPADRGHVLRVATADPGGPWQLADLAIETNTTEIELPGRAVVLDPYEDTWALITPDSETLDALVELLPATDDERLLAGIWNNVRSAFHNAQVAPARVLDLLEAGLPGDDSDDAWSSILPWAIGRVAGLADDPTAALARIHRTCEARLADVVPGSTVQLAAFQAAIDSSVDADRLRGWLGETDLPDGLALDLELRWRVLVRLATLGQTDRDELRRTLDVEPTAVSQVEHDRAVASLPDPEAKAWAWNRFLGGESVPNYELEASGLGMWRAGQESLTAAYADRYFDELAGTVQVRSGWVLADAARWFFPVTALDDSTLARAQALAEDVDLDLSLRRAVVDSADDLRRRIAVRREFGSA